jgi:HSP20 family molecular chaperone IbpA
MLNRIVPPWNNEQEDHRQHRDRRRTTTMSRMERDHRRRLVVAVRTLLYRQHLAYHRRMVQLQEQYNQQIRKYSQLASVTATAAASELMENDSNLRLTLDLPGINKQDIQIQIDTSSNELQIKAKRLYMSMDGATCVGNNMKCRRYSINTDVVDVSQMHATLHNGVLTITAPKKSKIQPTTDTEMHDATKQPNNTVASIDNNNGEVKVEGMETSTIIYIGISDA